MGLICQNHCLPILCNGHMETIVVSPMYNYTNLLEITSLSSGSAAMENTVMSLSTRLVLLPDYPSAYEEGRR